MSVDANKKLVMDTWLAFWRGDIEEGVANMSDDIAWFTPGTNQLSGWKRGKDAIRAFRFGELDIFLELKREIIGLYGDGDTVVMEARAVGQLRNGDPYENAGCVVWQLEDGKIRTVRQYVDTQKAAAISALAGSGSA
jgi:ketosteroid isomerase-like protein